MSKQEKKGLVPALRFPDFKNAGGWELKSLDNIATFLKGKGVSKADITEEGIPCIRYGELYTHYSEVIQTVISYTNIPIKDVILSNINDVIIPSSGETAEDIATASCVLIDGVALGGDLNIIRTNISGVFLSYYLNYAKKKEISELAQGIAVVHLYISQLKNLKVCFPKIEEQQKIADCLLSLDELIAAQNQKFEALKAHKKGLMQQLFPAEGETAPKLRFSEFKDKIKWSSKKFGEICKFVRGPFGGALKKEIFVKEGYAVYEQSHAIHRNFDSFRYYIDKEKFNELKRFEINPNDIIMSCSGTMGKFAVIPSYARKGIINQALLKLTLNKGYELDFIKFTLEYPTNQEKLLSQSAGGAIKNVAGVGQLKEIEIFTPCLSEQQKIADCLSSLDELITAQSQKIEALKLHKKGLMQQLFPVMGEETI